MSILNCMPACSGSVEHYYVSGVLASTLVVTHVPQSENVLLVV